MTERTPDTGQQEAALQDHRSPGDGEEKTVAGKKAQDPTHSWASDTEEPSDHTDTESHDPVLQTELTAADKAGMDSDSRSERSTETVVMESSSSEEEGGTDAGSLVTGTGTGTGTGTQQEPGPSRADANRGKNILTSTVRNRLYRDALYTIPRNDGTGNVDITARGTLTMAGDQRDKWTHMWCDTNYRYNASTSFDLEKFTCLACDTKHSMNDQHGRSVIIITDQMFAPAVPVVGTGLCMGIIRVEDTNLTELAFILKEKVRHHIWAGSVILIGAGTQLMRSGLAAYCTDLAGTVADLRRALPRGCLVSHCPLLLNIGTSDKVWLDAIADLTAWLDRGGIAEQGTDTFYLPKSHNTSIKIIKECARDDRESLSTASRVIMPASLGDRTPTVIQVGDCLMPDSVLAPSLDHQSRVLSDLICEIIDKSKINLSAAFRYRYVEEVPVPASDAAQAMDEEEGSPVREEHLIFIGGGHAARMRVAAVNAGIDSQYIGMKTVTRATVAEITTKLTECVKDLPSETRKKTVIVYAALDSQGFTSYEEDSGTAQHQSDTGEVHYPGFFVTVPAATFKRLIEISLPILTVDSQIAAVIVMPFPKFLNGRGCCDSKGHVTNLKDRHFRGDMLKALAGGKNDVNKFLVNEEHFLVRAVNMAPALVEQLEMLEIKDTDSEASSGYLPLEDYVPVIDEVIKTATLLRAKRAQYLEGDQEATYNRNLHSSRCARGERSVPYGRSTYASRGHSLSYKERARGSNERSQEYDQRAEANSRARESVRPQERHNQRSSDYRAADQPQTRQQSTHERATFGAVDIRYLSEDEQREIEARSRNAQRRGRGGLYNLGRYTKNF